MNTQPKYTRCGNCEHALITGVACDTGPADCPQMDTHREGVDARYSLGRLGAVIRDLALPNEYDAIRGMD